MSYEHLARGGCVLLASLALACASKVVEGPKKAQPPVEFAPKSGSRLQLIYDDGGSGALSFVGILDSNTQEPCAFKTAADGKLRCLPSPPLLSAASVYQVRFADAACTQPLPSFFPSGCGASAFLEATFTTPSCGLDAPGSMIHVYQPGAAVSTGTMTPYYALVDGVCSPSTYGDFFPGSELLEVPPTDFVAATTQRVDVGGGLAIDVASADDGSQTLVDLIDSNRNAACSIEDGFAGDESALLCAPSARVLEDSGYGSTYSDKSCSDHGVLSELCVPDVIEREPSPGCKGFSLFHASSATLDAAYEVSEMNTCVADPEATGYEFEFYSEGAPIPIAQLPAVSTATIGTGRLRAQYRISATGVLLQAVGLIDTERGNEPCVPLTMADGVIRCLPTYVTNFDTFGEGPSYSDTSCSHFIVNLGWVGWSACPDPLPELYLDWSSNANDANCPPRVAQIHQIAGPSSVVQAFYRDNTGQCLPRSIDPYDHSKYAEMGDIVDPSTFAEVGRVTM